MNERNINKDQFNRVFTEQVEDQQIIQKAHQLSKFIFTQRSTKTVINIQSLAFNQKSKILVQNYLCKQEDNYLKKVTLITSPNKKVTIQDTYQIQISSPKNHSHGINNYKIQSNDKQSSFQPQNIKNLKELCSLKRKT